MMNILCGKEFEGLQDQSIDGSFNERKIFKEVFLEGESGQGKKRCLVTGVINFESDDSKQITTTLCSSSYNSAFVSEEYPCEQKEDLQGKPGRGCGSEDATWSNWANHEINFKRPRLSVDDSCVKTSGTVLNINGPSEGGDSSISDPKRVAVTCRLVESSSQGVTASCYLIKRQLKRNAGNEMNDTEVPKCKLFSLDGNDGKEIVANAMASPVSQESYTTKLLVGNPQVTITNKSGLGRPTKPKWRDYCFLELDEAELSLPKDLKNDPRPLLRYHINCLLRAAGWVIGRRKRNSKYNLVGEYVFKSPEGRPIREFHRAWSMCRGMLFSDVNNILRGSDYLQWTVVTQFRSDLSATASEIEKQLVNLDSPAALAHLWCLLDPFANVVFIKKTLRLFKEGKAVKARRSIVIHPYGKCESSFCSDDALSFLSHSSYSEKKHIGSLKTFSGNATKSRSISGTERISLCQSSMKICGSDCMCDETGICLFDVPVSSGNAHASHGGSDIVSPGQESTRSSVTCDKERSDRFEDLHERGSVDVFMQQLREDETFDLKPNPIELASLISGSKCRSYGFKSVSDDASVAKNAGLRRKVYNKSKKISEIRLTNLYHYDKLDTAIYKAGLEKMNGDFIFGSGVQQFYLWENHEESGSRSSKKCGLEDDDLLISAIIKKKNSKSAKKRPICKSKPLKWKSQNGSCKLLLRSLNRGGKHLMEGKWYLVGQRTILSWLIHSGVVALNEVIQYRRPKGDMLVKDGFITLDGILCKCCDELLSISEFKRHTGFRLNSPCLNLFMESGKPYTLCLLEAWSAEYKARKFTPRTVQVEEIDENDDSCGRCGDGGELICCDNCPSTFHPSCLYAQEIPEGNWYCPQCICHICSDVVDNKDSKLPGTLKCLQCENRYHEACLQQRGLKIEVASDTWCCSESCEEVYSGLQSRIGFMNLLSDGFYWTLLKYIHGDQKVHSAQRFVALKAECNSKLAVALTIMEECFLPMVDARTGIDMIPQVVYNWGSQFARLNYCGFYTVILEKNDIMMCIASIRIHGVAVAEMPLIATCSKYRRQGMCRRLVNSIEQMLKSLNVQKLVISAIPGLVETWTEGFGFKPLEDNEKRDMSNINLMVFPGTVWLKKPLCENDDYSDVKPAARIDDPTPTAGCVQGDPSMPTGPTSDQSLPFEEGNEIGDADCEKGQSNEDQENATVLESGSQPHLCSSVQKADSDEEIRPTEGKNDPLKEGPEASSSTYNQVTEASCDGVSSSLDQESKPVHCKSSELTQGRDASDSHNQETDVSGDVESQEMYDNRVLST